MNLLSIITCLPFNRPPVTIHNELLFIKSRYNWCTSSMTISKQQFKIKLKKVINVTCTSFVMVQGEWPIRMLYPINIVFWLDDFGVWVRVCLFTHNGVQIHIVLCFCFAFLRLVCYMLPVSLDCLFLIASSVFSNVYILYRKISYHLFLCGKQWCLMIISIGIVLLFVFFSGLLLYSYFLDIYCLPIQITIQ